MLYVVGIAGDGTRVALTISHTRGGGANFQIHFRGLDAYVSMHLEERNMMVFLVFSQFFLLVNSFFFAKSLSFQKATFLFDLSWEGQNVT